ncbi:MAG: AmmeMemoRadiSam system protein A [Acidobacteria bacterium]|nr:AmmeMemoRadiSam system protein A [Acidobacteriota bacterium]
MTSSSDRDLLLSLARDAIEAHVESCAAPSPPLDGVFARRGGAFVTLHLRGELRGCIGHVDAHDALGQVIARCAVAACSDDPRFPAVTPAELPHLDIELSLLGPLESVAAIEEIEIGRHGLVVEMHWRRGLLLPQVATEWKWDRETFLAQTCVKAGLPRDAWKNGASLWRFEAEVFGDR